MDKEQLPMTVTSFITLAGEEKKFTDTTKEELIDLIGRMISGGIMYVTPPIDLGKPPHETQESITQWAKETFGPVTDLQRAVERCEEEMVEFEDAYTPQEHIEEAADVVITFYCMSSALGYDLHEYIDRKMQINRQRKWQKDGTGHGYHIKD